MGIPGSLSAAKTYLATSGTLRPSAPQGGNSRAIIAGPISRFSTSTSLKRPRPSRGRLRHPADRLVPRRQFNSILAVTALFTGFDRPGEPGQPENLYSVPQCGGIGVFPADCSRGTRPSAVIVGVRPSCIHERKAAYVRPTPAIAALTTPNLPVTTPPRNDRSVNTTAICPYTPIQPNM